MNALLARTAGLLAGAALVAFPLLALTYPYGAPPTFDGYQDNCTACHRIEEGVPSEPNTGTGAVTITAPDVYVVGQPVEITVEVANTTEPDPAGEGRVQGFEVGVRDASGASVGSFDLGGSAQIQFAFGNPNFVTHTQQGHQQSSWTFDWIPPSDSPPEAVTIYAAGNAANGNAGTGTDGTTGDYIYTTQKTLALVTASAPGPDADAVRLGPISPQPVRARAQAVLMLREPAAISARLVDGRGRTVRRLVQDTRASGESMIDIDASGIAPGAYFLVVETPAGRRTARVVVAR